jgi:hypothetical protein
MTFDLDKLLRPNIKILKPYSHSTLLVVKSSQNQNGLRHNDYSRYH